MYTKIHDRIWSMFKRRGMTGDECRVYIYLFSCPHRNLLGMYRLPLSYVAEDLSLPLSAAKRAISSLEKLKLVEYDAANSVVFIPKFLECNAIPNKNVEKKAVKLAEDSALPDTPLWAELLGEAEGQAERLPALFEAVLKRYCKQYGKPFDKEYEERYANKENRKQKTEDRIQKAESSKSEGGPGEPAPAAADDIDLSDFFRKKICALTKAQSDKLREYARVLSVDVVQMAIEHAAKNEARSWAYVETILASWLSAGITTPAAVEAEQARFQAKRKGVFQDERYTPGEADQRAREDMERLREFLRKQEEPEEDAP